MSEKKIYIAMFLKSLSINSHLKIFKTKYEITILIFLAVLMVTDDSVLGVIILMASESENKR